MNSLGNDLFEYSSIYARLLPILEGLTQLLCNAIDHTVWDRGSQAQESVFLIVALESKLGKAPVQGMEPMPQEGPPPPHGVQASFKLRFATSREQGRSDFSAVKPRGLPSPVADKVGSGEGEVLLAEAAAKVKAAFIQGPRQRYGQPLPVCSSHEYGWWLDAVPKISTVKFSDRRIHHHIRDSSWLKARLSVLAADNKFKKA